MGAASAPRCSSGTDEFEARKVASVTTRVARHHAEIGNGRMGIDVEVRHRQLLAAVLQAVLRERAHSERCASPGQRAAQGVVDVHHAAVGAGHRLA